MNKQYKKDSKNSKKSDLKIIATKCKAMLALHVNVEARDNVHSLKVRLSFYCSMNRDKTAHLNSSKSKAEKDTS